MNIIVLINFLFHYLTFWYNTENSSFAASRKEFIYDKKKNYIYIRTTMRISSTTLIESTTQTFETNS